MFKKILLFVVVVVPLAMAGYVYWRVTAGAENAVKQVVEILAPYALIRHGEVSVDTHGVITVDSVSVQPVGMASALPVHRITITTPGLKYLVTRTGSDLWSRGRPETLTLNLSDVVLDLAGDNGKLLDNLAALTARTEASGIAHCGDHKQIGLAEWREMGINRLHADGSLAYNMDRARDTASLSLSVKIKDLLAVSAEAVMSQVQAASGSTPWLRGHVNELKVTYKDEGYLETLKRYCTVAAKTESAAYLDAEAGEQGSIFLQQLSMALSPTMRAPYREFLGRPDTVMLDIAVPPDFKIENWGLYNSTDMANSLAFTVSFNGKRADESQYGFRPPHDGPSQALLAAKAAVDAMNKPRVPTRKGESAGIIDPPKFVFHEIPKKQLPKYLGKRVRFHVTGSSMREGLLTAIDGGTAHIQQTKGDNQISLAIALRHVERVEVEK